MEDTRARKGFTLVEVLIILGFLGLLTGLSVPFYQSFQVDSQLDNTTREVIDALRRAQMRAIASENFSDWGVYFSSNSYTLFKGSSYSGGDTFNEVYELDSVISVSSGSGTAVVFGRVDGETGSSTTIQLESSRGETQDITINTLGVVTPD